MLSSFRATIIKGVKTIRLDSPLHAQVELTSGCTYDCFFCYNIWKSRTPVQHISLSNHQARFVASELIRCRIFSVVLSGGEPTLKNYLPELTEIFSSSNIKVSMITNGSRLTIPLLKRLKSNGLQYVQISMHHYLPEVFNGITKNSNAYELTLNGIRNALTVLGPDEVNINMVVAKNTITSIRNMSEFLFSIGVRHMTVSLVSTSGKASVNNSSCNYTDVEQAYQQMGSVRKEMTIGFVGGLPFCSLPADYDPSVVSMSNVCDAGITQIVVGPNGGLRPCVEWPVEAGNIFHDDIIDIWKNSAVFENIRKYYNTPQYCRSCEQVPYCHGGCRASALAVSKDSCGYDPMMLPVKEVL